MSSYTGNDLFYYEVRSAIQSKLRKPRGLQPPAWVLTRTIRWYLRLAVKLRLFHVSVEGQHNIPKRGAAIIACNHISMADPVVVWGSVPRNLIAVAMKELWHSPLVFVMWALGHIPVDRNDRTSGASARDRMKRVLKHNGLLLIFPEGKCSRDGTLLPLKSGVADIAFAMNVPVIPTGIIGSNAVWPIGKRWLCRREHITVHYGKPLHPINYVSAEALLRALREEIEILATPNT